MTAPPPGYAVGIKARKYALRADLLPNGEEQGQRDFSTAFLADHRPVVLTVHAATSAHNIGIAFRGRLQNKGFRERKSFHCITENKYLTAAHALSRNIALVTPMGGRADGKSGGCSCKATRPPFVRPAGTNPALR